MKTVLYVFVYERRKARDSVATTMCTMVIGAGNTDHHNGKYTQKHTKSHNSITNPIHETKIRKLLWIQSK